MQILDAVTVELKRKDSAWQDVLRCLSCLYGSHVGTLALDRDFGLDWSFLDAPTERAKALIEAEIITKTRKYEPRARVEAVRWDGDAAQGYIQPKVVIDLV